MSLTISDLLYKFAEQGTLVRVNGSFVGIIASRYSNELSDLVILTLERNDIGSLLNKHTLVRKQINKNNSTIEPIGEKELSEFHDEVMVPQISMENDSRIRNCLESFLTTLEEYRKNVKNTKTKLLRKSYEVYPKEKYMLYKVITTSNSKYTINRNFNIYSLLHSSINTKQLKHNLQLNHNGRHGRQ